MCSGVISVTPLEARSGKPTIPPGMPGFASRFQASVPPVEQLRDRLGLTVLTAKSNATLEYRIVVQQSVPLGQFHAIPVQGIHHKLVTFPTGDPLRLNFSHTDHAIFPESEFFHYRSVEADEKPVRCLGHFEGLSCFEKHVDQSAAHVPLRRTALGR